MTTDLIPTGTGTGSRVGPACGAAGTDRARLIRAGVWSLPEVRWAALATALFAVGLVAHFTGAPAAVAWTFFLASYAAGGWEPGLAGLVALRAKTLDVDLLMVAGRDRRRRRRPGPRRRTADRHLRHLGRARGGGDPSHRPGRPRAPRPGPRAGRADHRRRDRGDGGRRGPAGRRRDPGPPGRANRRRRPGALRRQRRGPGHDHRRAAAGGQGGRGRGVRRDRQRHRRAAGAGGPRTPGLRGRPDRGHGR